MLRLVLGLAAGLALGWALFHRPPESRRQAERPVAEPTPAPEPDRAAPRPPPAREALPPDAPTGLDISREGGKPRYVMGGRAIRPRPLDEIDASMAKARSEKNWPEFFAGILELIVHDSPEADRRLVALMGDGTLRLPGPWIGERFLEGLLDSEVEGIGAAALARAKVELEEKKGSRWAGRGFLALVARFGDDEDVRWIETLATSKNRAQEVERALALGAANPTAAALLHERLLGRHDLRWTAWREFASANPAAAFGTALELLPGRGGEAYRFLGAATRRETVERARSRLLSLTGNRDRLAAVRAVEEMRRNGLDTSGFEPLLAAPRLLIEAGLAGRAGKGDLTRAIHAIERNRVAWTDANLAALRAVAERGAAGIAKRAGKALEEIDEKRDEGWEPERS